MSLEIKRYCMQIEVHECLEARISETLGGFYFNDFFGDIYEQKAFI